MHLKNEIVQKIYKKQKSRSGKTVYNKKLIGIMVAGLDPDQPTNVNIGYSLCHKKDKWDHPIVDGIRIKAPGFGQKLAKRRAFDFKHSTVHQVPPSIYKQFIAFTDRCRRYFKGAVLPRWTAIPEVQHTGDGVRETTVIPIETDDGIVHCRTVENSRC